VNIGQPYYVAKTSLNKLALLEERLETAILWQVGGGVGGPVGIGHANMDGTFRYSYQLSDGAGSLVSFAIPDPGNVISTFSDPPGVELIPLPGGRNRLSPVPRYGILYRFRRLRERIFRYGMRLWAAGIRDVAILAGWRSR